MNSKQGGGQINIGNAKNSSSKGKSKVGFSSADLDQLNQEVNDMNMDSDHNDAWEIISKKNKNRSRNSSASASLTSQPKASAQAERTSGQVRGPNNVWAAQTGGRGSSGNYSATFNSIPPPLQSGWNWNSRPGNTWQLGNDEGIEYHDELDASDDELLSDEYDSDGIPKSHEKRKRNKWYAKFFDTLDALTLEQINEPMREWHCPACRDGPGSIDWYASLQSLITHAKTKGSKRVKLHRDLAQLLEEELRRKGANLVPSGESYGQWNGLNEVVEDKEIVWPPMVIIMNTQLEQDENEKWLGMGNQELLAYFGSYEAVRARHSYGPKGHRGMSVLIFESSAVGYTEAERLTNHFKHQGTDRDGWHHRRNLFYPGGKRQLYGYMATKPDMDIFNQHSHGKTKLKFELVSYLEKVVDRLKQMNEDNQQLHWYKTKILKEVMQSKALKESLNIASQKLRKSEEEKRIVRERTKRHHEETKEEMDYQEKFFKDQLKVIHEARDAEEHRMVGHSFSSVDPQKREELLEEMKEYQEEREMLMKIRDEKIAEMRSRHWKEEIELEEWLNAELTQLMARYTPKSH